LNIKLFLDAFSYQVYMTCPDLAFAFFQLSKFVRLYRTHLLRVTHVEPGVSTSTQHENPTNPDRSRRRVDVAVHFLRNQWKIGELAPQNGEMGEERAWTRNKSDGGLIKVHLTSF
jgi:hypothetical protein